MLIRKMNDTCSNYESEFIAPYRNHSRIFDHVGISVFNSSVDGMKKFKSVPLKDANGKRLAADFYQNDNMGSLENQETSRIKHAIQVWINSNDKTSNDIECSRPIVLKVEIDTPTRNTGMFNAWKEYFTGSSGCDRRVIYAEIVPTSKLTSC